jgi:hypothetical protein
MPARPHNGINWTVWLSVPSALAVLVVAVVWIGSIGSRVSDHENEIKAIQDTEAQHQHDAVASDAELYREIGALRVDQAKLTSAEAEIETQFCAADIVRNEEKSGALRNTAMLWQKVFGQPFPTDNVYYARICQPKSHD